MKILIDCQGMQTGSVYRGIGRYCHDLIDGLICQQPEDFEIALLIDGSRQESAARIFDDFKNRKVKFVYWYSASLASLSACQVNNAEINSELLYEAAVINSGADLLFIGSLFEGIGETFCLPVERLHGKIKIASICYDFIPFLEISSAPTEFRYWYARCLIRLRLCDLLLCISDYVKQKAEQFLGIKAVNISGGVNLNIFSKNSSDPATEGLFLTSQNINQPYFFYAGGLDARKNVALLLDAFSELVKENLMDDFELVIVSGSNIHGRIFLTDRISKYGLCNKIKVLGYVTDQELATLYRNAYMSVFPSFEEGLGMPILEAMASGIPVLSSNTTSMPEVHGMPQGQFSPHDKESLKRLLLRSKNDKAFYKDLSDHSQRHVKQFTWSNTAKRAYLSLYDLCERGSEQGYKSTISLEQVLNHFSLRKQTQLERLSFAQAVTSQFFRRIYVDVTGVVSSDYLSGIQRVVRKLSDALPNCVPEDYEVVYIGLDGEEFYSFKYENGNWFKKSKINPKPFDVVLFLDLNYALPDMHTFISSLKFRGVKVATIVYDLVYELHPEMVVGNNVERLQNWLNYITDISDYVICISKSVKDELINWCHEHKKKNKQISYFHLGSNIAEVENLDVRKCSAKGEKIRFIAVSTIEPRKGYDLLLRAFERVFSLNASLELHIVGKKGWNVEQLCDSIKNSQYYNKQLFWYENADDEKLIELMSSADVYVNASIYEGFGLPVVEAAKYNLPLFLRDIPVFKELAGDFANYFSTEDELVQCIQQFINNPSQFTPMPCNLAITWSQSAECLTRLLHISKVADGKQESRHV